MLQLSGDPIELMLGEEGSQKDEIRLRKALGLDKPIPIQYRKHLQFSHYSTNDLPVIVGLMTPALTNQY